MVIDDEGFEVVYERYLRGGPGLRGIPVKARLLRDVDMDVLFTEIWVYPDKSLVLPGIGASSADKPRMIEAIDEMVL